MALALTIPYGEEVKIGDKIKVIVKKANSSNKITLIVIADKFVKVESPTMDKKDGKLPEPK